MASWSNLFALCGTPPSPSSHANVKFPGLFMVDAGNGSFLVTRMSTVTSKVMVAERVKQFGSIGYDLAASALNGLATCGAKPRVFMYNNVLKEEDAIDDLNSGVVDACLAAECAINYLPRKPIRTRLLTGLAFGDVHAGSIVDHSTIADGDWLIGLTTNAVHTQKFDYSLVEEYLTTKLHSGDMTVGEALLARPEVYANKMLGLIKRGGIKAVAHISTHGLTDGISTVLPVDMGASIKTGSWNVPPVFNWLKEINEKEMYESFNMGVEMVLIAAADVAYGILEMHSTARWIGKITFNGGGVVLE